MEILQCTATLRGSRGQWDGCNALQHYLWQCLTTCGQWAMEVHQRTATLPVGNGRWNGCNALPHCMRTVGNGTPAMPCHSA